MRVVVVTPTVAERDAILADLGVAQLARLRPYTETRVVRVGIGTVVVVPSGTGAAAATVAAAVAANRLQPDALLSLSAVPDAPHMVLACAVTGPEGSYEVPARLLETATAALQTRDLPFEAAAMDAGSGPAASAAWGVAEAGRAHGVATGALIAAQAEGPGADLRAVAAALFAQEWWASAPRLAY